jgi:ubiquinone biosynthesis protein
MRFLTFVRFMRQITRKKPADLDWIQRQGLLAMKLAQIFALRPDLLGVEKCRQLQKLYQRASSLPSEDMMSNLKTNAPDGFFEAFEDIDSEPLAAASVGQVHRGRLKTGEEVVIKFVKKANAKSFTKEVIRMRRWLKIFMFISPKLRKVGNPMALLNHVADYTLKELDLRNEIIGANTLSEIKEDVKEDFPMELLRLPKYWPDLSNEKVLVSEFIEGISLEEGIESGSLEWETLLQLFRIHGAYLFGVGTFHGDLHPGNCIIDKNDNFVFIDNGAICHAPEHVNRTLFTFFEHLANKEVDLAAKSLLNITKADTSKINLKKYYSKMEEIYDGFNDKTVTEQSLTKVMMKTVRAAVELAKADFGEEAFPIIRALMYLDGLVIRTHPDAKLIVAMKPYLREFREGLNIEN